MKSSKITAKNQRVYLRVNKIFQRKKICVWWLVGDRLHFALFKWFKYI